MLQEVLIAHATLRGFGLVVHANGLAVRSYSAIQAVILARRSSRELNSPRRSSRCGPVCSPTGSRPASVCASIPVPSSARERARRPKVVDRAASDDEDLARRYEALRADVVADGCPYQRAEPRARHPGEWIELWNSDPRPYVWVKTAEQILASLARYCERLSAGAMSSK